MKIFVASLIVAQWLIFIVEALSQNIMLLDRIDIPGTLTTDVWGYWDETTGKEYALVGDDTGAGLTIVDVSDPFNLVQVANVPTVPGFDVTVWQHYVYTVTGGSGLGGIVDISDPENPQVVGSFPSSHTIFIADSGFMYLAFPGLRIFDLNQDPVNPALVWSGGTEGHDASVIGHRLYDFHGRDGTKIYDVTDPSDPQLLGIVNDPAIRFHYSGWASEDGQTLFICDELGDITVWDIVDPGYPQKMGEFSDSDATVHSLFLVGDLAYSAYYTAGFRIFDIYDPTQPVIHDEFDTSSFTAESGGAFGVYPFAPSGYIYVTDIHAGLFLFNFGASLETVFSVERTTGDVFALGSFMSGGADLAERIDVSEPVEPGDVVELDPEKPHTFRKARANSRRVAGVITSDPGFVLGNNSEKSERLLVSGEWSEAGVDVRPMMALMGRVPVKTTTENGPINPGDILTVSSKPGYAMRCSEAKSCEGTVVGKALEGLERGERLIMVLVMAH